MKTLLLLCVAICPLISSCSKSEGTRVGYVTKFSKTGWVNKTWEGDLSLGQFGSGKQSGVWSFSVDNESIAKQVQAACEGGKKVSVTYKKNAMRMPGTEETTYRVTGVTVLE